VCAYNFGLRGADGAVIGLVGLARDVTDRKRIDAELCVAALKRSLEVRNPPPGCIHHSDRGVQYACGDYIAVLQAAQMQISMSRTGCRSNVVRLIAFSTSAVPVCRSSASCVSLKRRAFWMAITA